MLNYSVILKLQSWKIPEMQYMQGDYLGHVR